MRKGQPRREFRTISLRRDGGFDMKNIKASIALTVVLLSSIALGLSASGKSVTGADLARALSGAAQSAGVSGVSSDALLRSLGKGPNAPLTEAGAVALLKAAGFSATTNNPNRPLTPERASALVREFGNSLASRNVLITEAGKGALPETIDDCYNESNHGQCVNCCKGMGGGASTCAKACMVINKPSGSEPQP